MLLLAYLFWGLAEPKNMGLLSFWYLVPPLWMIVVLLGFWCWWRARDAATLWLAIVGTCAAPLMLAIQSGLLQAELPPVAEGSPGYMTLVCGIFIYPLMLVVGLLLRLSRPKPVGASAQKPAIIAQIVRVLVTLLAILALLLVSNLFTGGSWLGKGTFETWLNVGFWTSLITGLLAGPLVLLSMLRRSLPLGFSMWILGALLVIALSYLAIYTFFVLHSAG